MSDQIILKYIPFQTLINPSFWYKLTQIKLDIDKLEENRNHIWGSYTNVVQQHNIPFLEIDCTSFNFNFESQRDYLPAHGYILNKNTIEQFKDCNKYELIDREGFQILENLKNGTILKDPSLLNIFFILSFADLKKYQYYFWFAFPIPGINVNLDGLPKNISESLNDQQINSLLLSYNNISDIKQKTYFIAKLESNNTVNVFTLNSLIKHDTENEFLCDTNIYFGFSDPSTSDSYPGWPLRNFITFLLYYCPNLQNKVVNILSMRLDRVKQEISCKKSIIFNVKLPDIDNSLDKYLCNKKESDQSAWIGWQKNDRGKFGPKMVDMSSNMDPIKLSENSVDLNLKLMKWRLLPDIDLDKIKKTKFLILGSGTLGCAVARNLLAWGAYHISLVDNGKVSYSNPVRQNLFNHEDCLNGGKPKALAAADNLKKIFPSVRSTGFCLNIPMPGHTVGEGLLEETKKNVAIFTELISTHDVIFLLMDSRESRWLPTVLSAHFNKIVINAALGFDSYLVMRHGYNSEIKLESKHDENIIKWIPGNELGCYFCNDITAPGNSLKDRTLDQQCTVTRPGISPIAGSLAVELVISILQHKDGAKAPAFYKTANDNVDFDAPNECLLGIIPHSIRGFLSTFSHVLPATRRYQKCIACSSIILEEYKNHGFEFLLNAFNSSKYLEDLTGLTELHQVTESAEMWEMSSSEESADE